MKQAIAGVAPPEVDEVTAMTLWPGITALPLGPIRPGCFLGGLYSIEAGFGNILTVGNLIALASIPLVLPPFFFMLNPGYGIPPLFRWIPRWLWIENTWCRRYRLTNRRVIIEHTFSGTVYQHVELDAFDAIDIEVQPGQEWFHAGDMIFRSGPAEVFRLEGVTRPETFRQTCLKAHLSYVGVKEACEREAALV